MTRSEFDDIRAHLTAEETRAGDLLQIAKSLLEDLEHAKMREATLRAYYLRLLTATRATVAAEAVGAPEPLTFVKDELAKRGQLPGDGETVSRILADAHTASLLIAGLERAPVRTLGPLSRARRCAGVSRTTPR
ncbi:hypothetical protein [Spongiactinospora sp. TRM90649]|uniref:hypothetical protein n=1 Tax=Spongiactinospora sp. TRM90649 TaxID=3031114 RepID=UPI0023F65B6E|nr:hypothetical protein [Spongiactinospora sp. TRM90649]MDF5755626.1 hypothetical protein [Spongiactinospora sp. TRM90649]